MESVNNANSVCHDCGAEIIINGELIGGGVSLMYGHNGKKINVLKCAGCFEKNKALNNFQECEVYSRVVGYIRPVQQWHKGKKQEFQEREEYKIPSNEAC